MSSCGCSTTNPISAIQPVYVSTATGQLDSPTKGEFYGNNPTVFEADFSFSAAATQVLQMKVGDFTDTQIVTLATGSGAYQVILSLDFINAIVGAIMNIQLNFPESSNPTVLIQDRQSTTTLETVLGYTLAYSTELRFVWNGTIWVLLSQV
jgi:hypothetical protein